MKIKKRPAGAGEARDIAPLLQRFAEPVLAGLERPVQRAPYKNALVAAAHVWNACRKQGAERQAALDRVVQLLWEIGLPQSDAREVIAILEQRHDEQFAANTTLFARVEVEEQGGRLIARAWPV